MRGGGRVRPPSVGTRLAERSRSPSLPRVRRSVRPSVRRCVRPPRRRWRQTPAIVQHPTPPPPLFVRCRPALLAPPATAFPSPPPRPRPGMSTDRPTEHCCCRLPTYTAAVAHPEPARLLALIASPRPRRPSLARAVAVVRPLVLDEFVLRLLPLLTSLLSPMRRPLQPLRFSACATTPTRPLSLSLHHCV